MATYTPRIISAAEYEEYRRRKALLEAEAAAAPEVAPEATGPTLGENLAGMGVDLLQGTIRAAGALPNLVEAVAPNPFTRGASDFFAEGVEAGEDIKPAAYREAQQQPIFSRDAAGGLEFTAPNASQIGGVLAGSLPQIPFIVGGAGLLSRAGQAAGLSEGVANVAGLGITNSALVSADTYDSTYRAALQDAAAKGLQGPEADAYARDAALRATAVAAPLSAATGAAGLGLATRVGDGRGLLQGALRGAAVDAPFEGIEEAGQALAQDYGRGLDPNYEQAASAGVLGAVAGGLPGAAAGALKGRRSVQEAAQAAQQRETNQNAARGLLGGVAEAGAAAARINEPGAAAEFYGGPEPEITDLDLAEAIAPASTVDEITRTASAILAAKNARLDEEFDNFERQRMQADYLAFQGLPSAEMPGEPVAPVAVSQTPGTGVIPEAELAAAATPSLPWNERELRAPGTAGLLERGMALPAPPPEPNVIDSTATEIRGPIAAPQGAQPAPLPAPGTPRPGGELVASPEGLRAQTYEEAGRSEQLRGERDALSGRTTGIVAPVGPKLEPYGKGFLLRGGRAELAPLVDGITRVYNNGQQGYLIPASKAEQIRERIAAVPNSGAGNRPAGNRTEGSASAPAVLQPGQGAGQVQSVGAGVPVAGDGSGAASGAGVAERTTPLARGWRPYARSTGTLAVPRSEMPQIKAEHRGPMVNFLNARGVSHGEETVDPKSLKPTQDAYSTEKVAKAKAFKGGDRKILISSDNHVVDGHHQWMAKLERGEPIEVIRLNAPIRELLPIVREFPSATTSNAGAKANEPVVDINFSRAQSPDVRDQARLAPLAKSAASEARRLGSPVQPTAQDFAVGRSPPGGDTLAKVILRVFGKDLVFFDVTNPAVRDIFAIDGVVLNDDQIFVNARTQQPHLVVIFHELLHSMDRTQPDLYKQLVARMRPLLRDNERYREEAGLVPEDDEATVTNEMIADLFARHATEPGFWSEVATRMEPSVMQRIAKAISELIDRLLSVMRRGRSIDNMDRFVTDLELVRGTLAEYTKAYLDFGADDGVVGTAEPQFRRQEPERPTSPGERFLLDAERDKLRTDTAVKFAEVFRALPSANEMAAAADAGKAKRGWYEGSTQALVHVFGPDAPRFAALLAATSPQTSVESNLVNALNIWKNWIAAKRPTDRPSIIRIMGRSVQGNKGEFSVLPAWVNNSVRALSFEDPTKAVLSGPKVNSFFRNLIGVTDEVTNDAWMANFAAVNQRLFSGALNKAGTDPGKGPGYLAMSARVRQAADVLSRLTGDKWTPAEVQETIWSWAKATYEMQDDVNEVRGARQLVAEGAVTDQLINATPDFRTLLNEDTYARVLHAAGYGDRLGYLRDATAGKQVAGSRGQAAPFAREVASRLLDRAAKRLEERHALHRGGVDFDPEQDSDIVFSRQRAAGSTEAGELPGRDGRGVPGAGEPLADDGGQDQGAGSEADLTGLPSKVKVPTLGEVEFHAYAPARRAAREYMRDAGLPYNPPKTYAKVDPARAARIADAYAAMPHAPQDPEVKRAYAKMIEETAAQYRAALAAGLKVEFMPSGVDLYDALGPRGAILDVVRNNHMYVFSTRDGFGTDATFDASDNPLLGETEFEISGQKALVNDLFRVVHDYFGHIKDGVGFRADGEENAWRSHSAMYSPLARRAMTSETRGQNSWLNYGPHGEKNRTAKTADTVFADQKTGLLPQWAVEEGAGDEPTPQFSRQRSAQTETPEFKRWFGDSKVVDAEGKPLVVYHGTAADFDAFKPSDNGEWGRGIYLTNLPDAAGKYAQATNDGRPNVIPVYASVRTPAAQNAASEARRQAQQALLADAISADQIGAEMQRILSAQGYDGVLVRGKRGNMEVVAFRPEQIKSATGNRGTFDAADPRINFSRQRAEKPFYSALTRAVEASKTTRAPPGQWKATLANMPGVKREEIEWSGVGEWLAQQTRPVTRDELLDFVRANEVSVQEVVLEETPTAADELDQAAADAGEEVTQRGGVTKFSQYQLPGGKNYRELLLTLPRKEVTTGDVAQRLFGKPMAHLSEDERQSVVDEMRRTFDASARDFRSSHWDEPNVLAHVRFNERTDADGKRVLFIEEIQSDWHQKGRKEGYKAKPYVASDLVTSDSGTLADGRGKWTFTLDGETVGTFVAANEAEARSQAIARVQRSDLGLSSSRGVPNAPLKQSWPMTAMKRMLRYAAENGFDRIAWTTGEQQAKRYDLSRQVDRIDYDSRSKNLVIHGKGDGGRTTPITYTADKEKVADYIGKEAAERLFNNPDTSHGFEFSLQGNGLKVGGEGMKAFYDRELVNEVNRYTKKWGGKMGRTTIGSKGDRSVVHSLDITPAMQEAALQPQPMFSRQRRAQTDTPEFKRWFGDSKVVDAEGKPLVVYHGTEKAGFSSFDPGTFNKASRTGAVGFYFTNHKLGAETYSGTKREAEISDDPEFNPEYDGRAGNYSVYLSIKQPLVVDFAGGDWSSAPEDSGFGGQSINEIAEYAIDSGLYDGVIVRNLNDEGRFGQGYGWGDTTYIAFRPEQIKSATGNRGTFDPADPRINFSRQRRAQTETPEFKRWFGDSKVVDADGKPLVVYHGTRGTFDAFEAGKRDGLGSRGFTGFYFTPVEWVADSIAANLDESGEPRVIAAYLTLKNPVVIDMALRENVGKVERKLEAARAAGHDGAIIKNWDDGIFYPFDDEGRPVDIPPQYVAFRPEQIKSAIGNRGTFDAADPRINFSRQRPAWIDALPAAQQEATRKAGLWAPQIPLKQKLAQMAERAGLKLAQGIADQFAPIKELDPHAYILARLSKSTDAALEATLLFGKPFVDRDGAIDIAPEKGGFVKVLQDLGGEHDRFMAWIAGNRAAQLKAEGRENNFTDIDISALKDLNQGTMKDGRSRSQVYTDAHKKYNEYGKAVLDIAEHTGLINGAERSKWERDFYVPFYRVLEEQDVSGPRNLSGLTSQYAFKKLKGGEETLNDLLENTMRNWSHLLAASMKNQAAASSIRAAERMGVATPLREAEKGSVYFLDKGKKQHYMVDDPLVMDAITALDYAGMKGLPMKTLQKFKHFLTMGVTASPTFRVNNLLRDSLQAMAVTPVSGNPLRNIVQGFKTSAKDSPEYASMLAGGALMRFGSSLDGNQGDTVKRMIDRGINPKTILTDPTKVGDALRSAWDWWQDVGDRAESITRGAIYKQLRAQGRSHLEASFAARDAMDFSMQGHWTAVRLLTQVVPFLNARLQGLYKLGRDGITPTGRAIYNTVTGQPVDASDARRAMRFSAVLGAVALASVLLMAHYHDDEDWKNREEWDRDGFWWFKIGDTAYRIPKPFEIGAMGTIAERGAEAMMDGMTPAARKRFVDRLLAVIGQNLAMRPVPQLFSPIIDVYSNKSAFTGRPIETAGMERLSKAERIGPNTSAVAQALGSSALSPVQIDALINGYFGWLGAHAVMAADMAMRPAMGLPDKPALKLSDYFVIGDFAKNLPTNQSRFVTEFYEQAQEAQQAMADVRHYQRLGDLEKAREILEEKGDKVRLARYFTHVQDQLGKINQRIRYVQMRTLDPEAKRAELDRLYQLRNRLARAATERAAAAPG